MKTGITSGMKGPKTFKILKILKVYAGKYMLGYLLGLIFFCSTNAAYASSAIKIRVSDSDDSHMVLEVMVNSRGLFKNTQLQKEKFFPRSFAELLGIPPAAGFDVKILKAEYSFADFEGNLEDTVHDEKNPGNLRNSVTLNPLGLVRDQRIAKLLVNPLQVDSSSGKRKFLRKILLKIDFKKGNNRIAPWDGKSDSESFEKVLKYSVANYEQARKYRTETGKTREPVKPFSVPVARSLKIGTRKQGIYRVFGKDLIKAGAELGEINPGTFRLFNMGHEIPIWVSTGKQGVFAGKDAITFYAVSPPEEYRVYTDENIYWLTWGGENGKRMETKNGDIGEPADIPFSFKVTFHGEKDREYMNPPPSSQIRDRWFWASISATKGNPGKRYFVIPGLYETDQDKEFTIRVCLQGLTDDPRTDRDHHTVISINDHVTEDAVWAGQEKHCFEGSFPGEYLVDGDNVIKVELPGDTDAFADQVFFNWFEIDWWTSVSQNGFLKFRYKPGEELGIYEFRCRDFRGKDIEVYDITDKLAVKRILNSRIEPEITTDVIFQDEFRKKGEERSYLVTESSRVMGVRKTEKVVTDADLCSPQNRADYIIITHENFYDEVSRLARYREKQGIRVKVVKIDDVYNQFSCGLFTPAAIRDFLKYAYHHWERPAPAYLLLVGDANWDYKDNMGYGVKNYVPSYLVPAHKNEDAASDNWFVCVSGDDILPDMHVGRFAVSRKEEVGNIVDKIIQYETGKGNDEWKKKVLFVADDEMSVFERQCDMLAEKYLSGGFESEKLYLGSLKFTKEMPLNEKIEKTNEVFSPKVLEAINRGCGIVQFVGHGGLRVWSHKHILNSRRNEDHWDKMDNKGRFPVVFTFSCLNGYFDSPRFPTIAERFMNERDKGAVAFASNTRDSTAIENLFLNRDIYDSIFNIDIKQLGPILTRSKIQCMKDVNQFAIYMNTFSLFGSPALRIKH